MVCCREEIWDVEPSLCSNAFTWHFSLASSSENVRLSAACGRGGTAQSALHNLILQEVSRRRLG